MSLEKPIGPILSNVKNISNSSKRPYHEFTETDTEKSTNASHNPPKICKLSNECSDIDTHREDVLHIECLQDSTVDDFNTHSIINAKNRTNVIPNDVSRTYSSWNIVITNSGDMSKIGAAPILQAITSDKTIFINGDDDDESVEDIPNSFTVNSLNWEVEKILLMKKIKRKNQIL